MKNTLLSILASLLIISASGQTKKFDIEIIFNPNYANSYIAGSKEARNAIDLKGIFGFDAGAQVKFFSKQHVSLRSGIEYSRKGLSWGTFYIFDSNNDPASNSTLKQFFHFVSIPITARYDISKQSPFYLQLGLRNDILLKQKFKIEGDQNNGLTPVPFDARTYNIGLNFSVGYKFSIHNMQFGIEPDFKYQLMGIAKGSQTISYHLYNIGLTLRARVY